MNRISQSSKTPSSSCNSKIPLPSSAKKTKARPAPDFSKLHKKWKSQFESGKAVTKKPCTVPQAFEVTKPGTKFQKISLKMVDGEDDLVFEFEKDQLALESIVSNRGLQSQTGRATIATTETARRVSRSKSCSNLARRKILGELACEPEAELRNRRRSRSMTKPVCLKTEKEENEDGFETDDKSLQSILNNTGIQSSQLSSLNPACRQTYAPRSNQPRYSIFDVPHTNLFDSVSSVKSGLKTDDKKKSDKKQTNADRLEEMQEIHTGKQSVSATQPKNISVESVLNTPNKHENVDMTPATLKDLRNDAAACTPQKYTIASAQVVTVKTPQAERIKNQSQVETTPQTASRVKSVRILETTPQTASRVAARRDTLTPLRKVASKSPRIMTPNMGRLRPGSECVIQKSQWDSPFGKVIAIPRRDSIFPDYVRKNPPDMNMQGKESTENKRLSTCHTPRRILKSKAKGTVVAPKHENEESLTKKHVKWADASTPEEQSQTENVNLESRQLFTAIEECDEIEESKENICPMTHSRAATSYNGISYDVSYKENCTSLSTSFQDAKIESKTIPPDVELHMLHCDIESLDQQGELRLTNGSDVTMAMHTEQEPDAEEQNPNQEAAYTRLHGNASSNLQSNVDTVENFVGRIKKNRKRQSVSELNESICESNIHLQSLQNEVNYLQNYQKDAEAFEEKHNGKENIVYRLELIKQQTEQLLRLQKQLHDQLNVENSANTEHYTDDKSLRNVSDANNENTELNANPQQKATCKDVCSVLKNPEVQCGEIRNSPVLKEKGQFPRTTSVSVFFPSTPTTQTISQSVLHSPIPGVQVRKDIRQCYEESEFHPFHQTVHDLSQSLATIMTPKPTKLKPSKEHDDIVDKKSYETVPPIWTPMALRDQSKNQGAPKSNGLNNNEVDESRLHSICPTDFGNNGCSDVPLDLTVKPLTLHSSSIEKVDQQFVNISITTACNSESAYRHLNQRNSTTGSAFSRTRKTNEEVGSLSLVGNCSTAFRKLANNALERRFLSEHSERYHDALLDSECANYLYILQAVSPFRGRGLINPIARILAEGDEMHFVPIREEKHVYTYREGSAFCCFSP